MNRQDDLIYLETAERALAQAEPGDDLLLVIARGLAKLARDYLELAQRSEDGYP